MPEISFDVYCGHCGAGLCNDSDVNRQTVTVDCTNCREVAEQEGYDNGYEAGVDDGRTEGYAEGYDQAVEDNN